MSKLIPHPYQEQGIDKITEFDGRILIADEMGLGKTLQAALWVSRWDAFPLIVVCPAMVKYMWEREISNLMQRSALVLEGRKPSTTISHLRKHQVIIINYQILGGWLKLLKSWRPLTVIIDECQFIKSRTSQTYKNVHELCTGYHPNRKPSPDIKVREVPHIIALSGTPMTNRPVELWTVANLLRPDIVPSFNRFAHRFCAPRLTRWGWDFRGSSNINKLHHLTRDNFLIRRLKKDVLKELPPKIRTVIPLRLDKRDMDTYRAAEKDFIRFLTLQDKNKARKAKKAENLVRFGYLKRLVSGYKLKQIIAWIDNFLLTTNEKLVVFGLHYETLDPLYDRYKDQAVLVTGKITGRKRQVRVNKFINEHSTRLFIANMLAAGTGIDGLQKTCQNMAIVEIGWTPGLHGQAEGRLDRIGQRLPVNIFYPVAQGTIEEKACNLLQSKSRIIDSIINGHATNQDLDIYDELISSMRNAKS